MIDETIDDVIKGDYHCPRCGLVMKEKKPKDRHIVRDKDRTVRLFCVCGHLRDIVVNPEDFT
ncbi:hypothetical protein E2P64_08365 [Candidatus Bathyarchaeota archaeon]|nr:hypothetical protein E2P64_08365 [Candidatus Bathyarchaeota archaeon]